MARGPLTRRREASWEAEEMPRGMTPSERVRWLHDRREAEARRRRAQEQEGRDLLARYPGSDTWERFRAFMREMRGDDR